MAGAPRPASREDLPRRRLGARRAAGAPGRRPGLGRHRRDAGDPHRFGLQARRPRLPGLSPSRHRRGICAGPHRAQARPRISRLRVLRLARRHARRGSRPPRSDDQRHGARREGRADRSLRRAGRSSRGSAAPRFPRVRRGSAARVARRAVRRALRIRRRAGNPAPDARAGRVRRARGTGDGARLAGARARADGAASGAPARRAARMRRAGAAAARGGRALWREARAERREGRTPGPAWRWRWSTRRGTNSRCRSAMPSSPHRLGDAGKATPAARRRRAGDARRAAAPSGCPSGSRCRWSAATPRVSPRGGIGPSSGRRRSGRRPCSISSTPPTRCVVRSDSTRCCRRASAASWRRRALRPSSRPRRSFARRSTWRRGSTRARSRARLGEVRHAGVRTARMRSRWRFARRASRHCARGSGPRGLSDAGDGARRRR